jgi:hypothetical protein
MLRSPTLAALAFGAAAIVTPAEARVFAQPGLTSPAAVEHAGGRWDDRYRFHGWGDRRWSPPFGHGHGWGPPPRPGWYYVPPPRYYGWAPLPPPRHYPPRPRVEFSFRF